MAGLTLGEEREDRRALAQRFAELLNQGFRDPNVEKVSLRLSIGSYASEDGDDLTKYKATADDDMIRVDSPKRTWFVLAGNLALEGVVFQYRQARAGQYL